MHLQLWLVRHGETEWSASGQHTGRTDLPLTLGGKLHARQIAGFLGGRAFTLVLTSPLQRARETCRLAGYGESAIIDTNLREWDYGEYEGRTTPEIQIDRPGWSLWRDGVIGGERIERVAARAQKVIDRAAANSGDVLVFAHGHILRVLAACWLDLPPDAGRLFALGTASVSVLGYESDTRVITQWNGGAMERSHSRHCVAAHSQIAKTLLRTPAEVIAAVQNNTPVPDAKLNALVNLVKELLRERGYAKEKTMQKFLAAGYRKEQVMELLLGIALKTISNYLDHISPTPLDHALAGESK